ncbi:hypothetical protein LCGC14_0372290 [marine sediment metagenome]|uniref:TFIIS-type domain-containing protein n=1 Tax=marine sediment metagenome TaxID=412755 RepID=A0A0F9WD91_9ZZZZ
MPDVAQQTKPSVPMKCPECGSEDSLFRLPRDTGKKESSFACLCCDFWIVLP